MKRIMLQQYFKHTALLLLMLRQGVMAQSCACNPTVFTFTFDFSGTCEESTVQIGSDKGLRASQCFLINDNGGEDKSPVSVTSITVFELDPANLGPIAGSTEQLAGDFKDGDTFEYTSITSEGDTGASNIPAGMQFEIHGVNAAGEKVTMDSILTYTNSCSVYPFSTEDTYAWLVFTELATAQIELCDLVSHAPSVSPSSVPSMSPSSPGTASPNASPSMGPSLGETPAPSMNPSSPGTAPPIKGPSPGETPAPSMSPSSPGTASPTASPSMSPSSVGTPVPTKAPVTQSPDSGGGGSSKGKGKKNSKGGKGKSKSKYGTKSTKSSKSPKSPKSTKSSKSTKSPKKSKGKKGKSEKARDADDKMRYKHFIG